MLTRSNIKLDSLLRLEIRFITRSGHEYSLYLRVLYDPPNFFTTDVQDFINQLENDIVANDEHGVVMPR